MGIDTTASRSGDGVGESKDDERKGCLQDLVLELPRGRKVKNNKAFSYRTWPIPIRRNYPRRLDLKVMISQRGHVSDSCEGRVSMPAVNIPSGEPPAVSCLYSVISRRKAVADCGWIGIVVCVCVVSVKTRGKRASDHSPFAASAPAPSRALIRY